MSKSARRGRWRKLGPRRKKNGGGHPARNRAGTRSIVTPDLPGSAQDGASGFRSPRNGGPLRDASGGSGGADRTAAVPSSGGRPEEHSVRVRSPGLLPGITGQTSADGSRASERVPSLLLVRALPFRPISSRCGTGSRTHLVLAGSAAHAGHRGSGEFL